MHWDYAITSRSKKEACPYGTIPIHRTTDEDEEERATNPSNEMFHHIGHINFGSGSSYNVTVAQDQSSFGTVLVQNGPPDRPNILAAGWTVMHFNLHPLRFLLEFFFFFNHILITSIQETGREN